jgi:hypothetical protein
VALVSCEENLDTTTPTASLCGHDSRPCRSWSATRSPPSTLALSTSEVEPLPHQISGVYEQMLARQPLRFLLADDPGVGKISMASLLIKDLLRGHCRS